jgi:hypothetical protein
MVLLELLTPIGKGQRGLLVAPPRTGKTILMEKIANGIADNHPEAEILMLLIDERPEEVTHLTRRIKGKVYASCLDRPIEEHITLTQMVLEMAQRRVECGKDVVILLNCQAQASHHPPDHRSPWHQCRGRSAKHQQPGIALLHVLDFMGQQQLLRAVIQRQHPARDKHHRTPQARHRGTEVFRQQHVMAANVRFARLASLETESSRAGPTAKSRPGSAKPTPITRQRWARSISISSVA